MQALQTIIDDAFENRASLSPSSAPAEIRDAVEEVIAGLDAGTLRVAEKKDGQWMLNQWIKKAVLISFRLRENEQVQAGGLNFFDKVDTKFGDYTPEQFREGGFRVVPPAVARKGSFIGRNVVLMPSYVNIGAYVDEGTMVDTWATVGSCAQIGKNVHLSGGVGIGGVLEPIQAGPVIIEDNVFVGPNVTFTNDLLPRSKNYPDAFLQTVVRQGASIGANATIIAGITIGQYAMIGAGSVVTRSIPTHTIWYGNPAKFKGYVCRCGQKLAGNRTCGQCGKSYVLKEGGACPND